MGEPALLVIDSATETLSLAACARGQSAAWSAALTGRIGSRSSSAAARST
jgi:hypothetical protein